MTHLRAECPTVLPGDHESYLRRANWALEHYFDLDQALADIDTATMLAPDAWQPWELRAKASNDNAALQIRCYDEAVARGADLRVRLARARSLRWIGKLGEAEADFSVAIQLAPDDPSLRFSRAEVRAELGKFAEALADVSPPSHPLEAHDRRVLRATLQWIEGDFEAAYREFNAPSLLSSFVAFFNIWSHLCQVAHGAAGLMCESVWAPHPDLTPRRLTRIALGDVERPKVVDEPWDVLLRMFKGHIEAPDVLQALSENFRTSNEWQPPASPEGAPLIEFIPWHQVWRDEIQFYCGMWYLSRKETGPAVAALSEAAACRRPRSLERLAAAAQLRRLELTRGTVAARDRLVQKRPSPSYALDRFLTSGLPPSARTRGVLQLNGQALLDEGLRLLLASPHLREVKRLELRTNGLTAAGAEALGECPHLSALTYLDVSENRLGDVGLKRILQSTAMTSLETLNIEGIELTDEGADYLIEQPIQLSQIMLGDTPIDMPIWRELARRYGEGLHARGDFNRPYHPPFDRSKQVSFVTTPEMNSQEDFLGRTQPSQASGCVLRFSVADYVAVDLRRLARLFYAPRRNWGLPFVARSLKDMEEVERRCASWPNQHMVKSYEGFSLLAGGVEPLELHCSECAKSYGPPFEGPTALQDGVDYVCPVGHLIHRARLTP